MSEATITDPADDLRRLRDLADQAAGEVVVVTTRTGVTAAAVTCADGTVLALHGDDGPPRAARLLAMAFFGSTQFASGDGDSHEFAVYHGGTRDIRTC